MTKVRDVSSARLKGVNKNKSLGKRLLKKTTPNGQQNPRASVTVPTNDQCIHAIAVNLRVIAEELKKFNDSFAKAADG